MNLISFFYMWKSSFTCIICFKDSFLKYMFLKPVLKKLCSCSSEVLFLDPQFYAAGLLVFFRASIICHDSVAKFEVRYCGNFNISLLAKDSLDNSESFLHPYKF